MKLCYFYDANFAPLRDQFVASLEESGNAGDFVLDEDLLEDLGTLKFRAGGGMPTYLYKSAKICQALDNVADGEVFVFMDVDIQFLGPVRSTLEACMASGVDIILQKEFEDIGVNIGFMGMRNSKGLRAFWKYVHAEIARTQALDQRVANNALYSGFALSEFGLTWDRWPSSIWASSLAFSGPLPETVLVHHANFLLERAASADPQPKCKQLACLRDALLRKSEAAKLEWDEYMAKVPLSEAMLDYRDRHFGARRPGPEWSTLPEGHIARPGGFSEKTAKKAAKRANDQANADAEDAAEETAGYPAADAVAECTPAADTEGEDPYPEIVYGAAVPEKISSDKMEKKMKKVVKEGGKRGVEIEGAADMGGLAFFCTTMEEPAGDVDLLYESMRAMNFKSDPSEEERKGGSGRIGKMIISTDQANSKLALVAYCPPAKHTELKAADWMKELLVKLGGGEVIFADAYTAKAVVPNDPDKNLFVLKLKDSAISESINFLKSKGLFPDKVDDSDDEFVFGDDDFPSM